MFCLILKVAMKQLFIVKRTNTFMKCRIQCLDWVVADRTKGKLNLDKVAEFVKAFNKSVFKLKIRVGRSGPYVRHFKKSVPELAVS